jgi:hypothetical protein
MLRTSLLSLAILSLAVTGCEKKSTTPPEPETSEVEQDFAPEEDEVEDGEEEEAAPGLDD